MKIRLLVIMATCVAALSFLSAQTSTNPGTSQPGNPTVPTTNPGRQMAPSASPLPTDQPIRNSSPGVSATPIKSPTPLVPIPGPSVSPVPSATVSPSVSPTVSPAAG